MGRKPPRNSAFERGLGLLKKHTSHLPKKSTVIVACSGGADSLALSVLAAKIAAQRHWRLIAVVVDHGLQSGSENVAAFAAKQCQELGFDQVFVERVSVELGQGNGGIENAARNARYQALNKVAKDAGAAAILLGHTLDDQAETMLLGLARGAGNRSIHGMAIEKGKFLRPIIALSRAETEEICHWAELSFWQDPTNFQTAADAPLRSRVRQLVIPSLKQVLGEQVTAALARTAGQLQEDETALSGFAAELFANAKLPLESIAQVSERVGEESFRKLMVLDCQYLIASYPAIRKRCFRLALLEAGCAPAEISSHHLEELERLIVNWRGQGAISLPSSTQAIRENATIVLQRQSNYPEGKR